MDDNNINKENGEILKRKKIRRLLLLKTDEELKKMSKKNANIMINSKTIREINKSYKFYNILLSEKTKIYFYRVKTGEKIVSNNIKTLNTMRITKNEKKKVKSKKLFNKYNSEVNTNSPILGYLPKKLELRIKRYDIPKRSSQNERKDNLKTNENNLENVESKDDKVNKSIKIEKRGLFKLVDKIVNFKMNKKIEKIIKNNIIKLRKYCNELKKPKKRIKRLNKQKTQSTPKNDDDIIKRGNYTKRFTIANKNFLNKKSLFEKHDKNLDSKLKRNGVHINTTKSIDEKLQEMHVQKEKSKEKNELRLTITRGFKKRNSINKLKKNEIISPPPNKRKLSQLKTLTDNINNEVLERNKLNNIKYNRNIEITKNNEMRSTVKNHLLSSKFERPKLQFKKFNKNSSTKNMPNRVEIKSLFNQQSEKNNKNIYREKKEKKENILSFFNNKEKNEKNHNSTKKTKRYSIKI